MTKHLFITSSSPAALPFPLMGPTLTVRQVPLSATSCRLVRAGSRVRLAVQQHEPRVLVRVAGACVVARLKLLNHWLATEVVVFRPP